MARTGRPPKPTALKLLHGTARSDRVLKNEPQPEIGRPTRPHWLLPEAKREWSRIVPELLRLGLLAKIDRAMISMWCQCWGMYVEAIRDIRAHGTTYSKEDGYEGQRPSVSIMNKMIEKMTALSARFGMTPSDRSRINVPKPEEKSAFADFLAESEQMVRGRG